MCRLADTTKAHWRGCEIPLLLWQTVQAQAASASSPALRVRQGATIHVSFMSLPRQTEEHSQDTLRTQTQLYLALSTFIVHLFNTM